MQAINRAQLFLSAVPCETDPAGFYKSKDKTTPWNFPCQQYVLGIKCHFYRKVINIHEASSFWCKKCQIFSGI